MYGSLDRSRATYRRAASRRRLRGEIHVADVDMSAYGEDSRSIRRNAFQIK